MLELMSVFLEVYFNGYFSIYYNKQNKFKKSLQRKQHIVDKILVSIQCSSYGIQYNQNKRFLMLVKTINPSHCMHTDIHVQVYSLSLLVWGAPSTLYLALSLRWHIRQHSVSPVALYTCYSVDMSCGAVVTEKLWHPLV